MNLRALSDEQLLSEIKRLAGCEREVMIKVLHHLLEVDLRKLFSPQYRSLFEYSVQELGYSADQASRRLDAMRLLREIPAIESKVASAELNLTVMGLAQTHFRNEVCTVEEKAEILRAIEGKSTREAVRELMKRSSTPDRAKPESVRPVSATTNELRLYVNDNVLRKIEKMKGRLAHAQPGLSNSALFELLLDRTLEETDRELRKEQKRTSTAAPRKFKRAPGAGLKREVFRKADGACEKCGSHHALEYDHRTPFALGGRTVRENLRLLCRNCNQRERVKVFGVMSFQTK